MCGRDWRGARLVAGDEGHVICMSAQTLAERPGGLVDAEDARVAGCVCGDGDARLGSELRELELQRRGREGELHDVRREQLGRQWVELELEQLRRDLELELVQHLEREQLGRSLQPGRLCELHLVRQYELVQDRARRVHRRLELQRAGDVRRCDLREPVLLSGLHQLRHRLHHRQPHGRRCMGQLPHVRLRTVRVGVHHGVPVNAQ
jgi:hypothetical protein